MTGAPDPQPRSHAKLHFHIALAGMFCPGVGVPITWALALFNKVLRVEDPEHKRWSNRLVALALVDTLLLGLLAAVTVAKGGVLQDLSGSSPLLTGGGNRRIGVMLEPGTSPPEITALSPGYPAERAGLEPGDVLIEVNGEQVEDGADARQKIAATPEGQEVQVTVQRDGQPLKFSMTAVTQALGAPKRGLFEPESNSCAPATSGVPVTPFIAAFVVGALYLAGRRKGADASIVWAALLLGAVSLGSFGASQAVCQMVGGSSRGGLLVALLSQTVLLVAGGALLLRRVRSRPFVAQEAPEDPRWYLVALLGVLYLFSGAIRVGLLFVVIGALTGGETSPFQGSPLHEVGGSELGFWGAVLFILPVVIIGPIGEELLFRGVVLPWFAEWMRPLLAILLSGALFAVLHLYYGPFVVVLLVHGVVLGWVRLRSRGLKAPIALHIANNGLATAVLLSVS